MITIAAALAFAVCPPPPARRETCVHDGDTIWIDGEKLRLEDIDTPELNGRCEREQRLAIEARERLIELMNAESVNVIYTGRRGRYGRELVRLPGISERLVQEGLARRWGDRRGWC
ncbi:MAG: thermonuclease family protein [Pseudomonadota bacterium]